jgi:hypothetical protein
MLSRRAFSRTAELGQLYDANNDLLLPGSIIKSADLPKKMVSKNSTEFVEHNFLYADSTDDQFKHLEIDASLRLSLYAGLIEVGGSGKYLSTTKTNKRSIKGSFYYKLVKKDDELLLENIPFDCFDFNILNKGYNALVGDKNQGIEDLRKTLKHELIHAKDPALNHHLLKEPYDTKNDEIYYKSWTEFQTSLHRSSLATPSDHRCAVHTA